MFPKLSLPEYQYKVRENNDKYYILDPLRKKYVTLTPEEWVRQHFINFLIKEKNFPKGLFRIEKMLNYHKLAKRADIIVCDRNAEPILLVECKAANQQLTQEVFNQAATYNTKIRAKTSIITNGLRHFCYQTDFSTQKISFIQNIPDFSELDAE
ncbi:MAG: type I restriction enzyme HsdR N-terminal domain-containing protein [Bacteroidota bacterium]